MTTRPRNIAPAAMAAFGRRRWPSCSRGRDRHGRSAIVITPSASWTRRATASPPASNASAIGRGTRTVLMVAAESGDFYALTFALFKAGAVVVLIDPGMGTKRLGVCLREVQPEAFVGVPKAHLARTPVRLGPRQRPPLRHRRPPLRLARPHTGSGARHSAATARFRRADRAPTRRPPSCSPAAAPASPRASSTRTASSPPRWSCCADSTASEPGEVDLPTFPLFGLFGPALGMTSVVPRDGPDPTGARRSAEDSRRHPRLRRDQPVRLAGADPARRRVMA